MDYRVCVAGESTQYPHKSYIPLQNAKKMAFLMEYRACVAGESTQYPHKSNISLQNSKKIVSCDGISCLWGC